METRIINQVVALAGLAVISTPVPHAQAAPVCQIGWQPIL